MTPSVTRRRRREPGRGALRALAGSAVLLLLTGLLGLQVATPAPARAAACSGSSGVTVVVDFNSLGGGVQGACVADGGGRTASALLPAAGFPLTYAQRQPGFVCRVSGVPTSDPCVNTAPADAYWGLWWSDGTDGAWTYSSFGAGSLRVPDGGYVAFAWDDKGGQDRPSYDPVARAQPAPPSQAPQPTQQPQPSQPPTQQPAPAPQPAPGTPTTPTAPSSTPATTATPTPGEAPTTAEPRRPRRTPRTTAPAQPSDSPSTQPGTEPSTEAPADLAEPVAPASSDAAVGDDGVPTWLALLVAVLLFAIAGVVVLLKRRQPGA